MLEVRGLTKYYGRVEKKKLPVVDHVSFHIPKGKTLGLAGRSGCGKSTIGRMILRLISCDSGKVFWDGEEITGLSGKKLKSMRKKMQIVFQNPEGSLDPSQKVLDSLMSPLLIHKYGNKEERINRILEIAELTAVPEMLFSRYPHQLSGGEAQRVVLCRALLLKPEFLVLDEATSMLDVSVQAQIMQLLDVIRKKMSLTCLFIGHDLDVIRWFCDDLAIMHQGKLVEMGQTEQVLTQPVSEIGKKLVDAFYNW